MKSNSRRRTHLPFIVILLALILHAGVVWGVQDEGQLAWGVNAVVLKSPWSSSPTMDELLTDQDHTISLGKFYRDGGLNFPATPTECRLAYNNDGLLVVFRCTESNMSFPAAPRSTDDWYSEINARGSEDHLFPDEVDFLIQPDMTSRAYYQFAMTPDGKKLGCSRLPGTNQAPGSAVRAEKLDAAAFDANVVRGAEEWVVYFKIPWSTFGGKPGSHFGVMPIRTRWRNGEVSSPVAFDFLDEVNSTMKSAVTEDPAVDLFIETHFSGPPVQTESASLCRLPSGAQRWQREAWVTYPDVDTLRQVWQLENSLSTPTDANNLAQRLYLTSRWTDLLTLEGLCFLHRAWSTTMPDMWPDIPRKKINAALRTNNVAGACQVLDDYLRQLDELSRWWYADGSPGDVLQDEWKPVTKAESIETQDHTLLMRCVAGGNHVDLHLAFPTVGGVRIYGNDEGYFKPAELWPIHATQSGGSCSIQSPNGNIVIQQEPFSISFQNADGKEVTRLGANDLAFRFNSAGKIIGLDFKNHLDPAESIYGFGERYDHFNENGHALTLWGTDDWVGNGVGWRNTTYKPLGIFHSSKGYMVFDNSTYRLRADVGQTDPGQYRLTQLGPIVDFYFFIGTPEQSLNSYTALTGRCPLPSKWVFEPWMGRGGGAWRIGPYNNPVANQTNTIARFAALDIPHSAIYAEGGGQFNSPVLHKFADQYGIRVLGYFMPAVRNQQGLMPELKPEQVPTLRLTNGETAPGGRDIYVDFTHPLAMELIRRDLKNTLDMGVAGSMVDFGDMVGDDAVFYDGRSGAEMHNFYSYAYHKTVSEVYREKRGDDFILYGRAAAPGGQHWVGQFAGDHSGNFAGLKAVLTGALNLCAGGYSTWGSDVCGYFGTPEPGVYMRWFQFACFSPIWRPHGKASSRDPWDYGDAAVTNYKFLAWTRENILDYTYNAAITTHETGTPIMRSMPVAFPDEPQVAGVGDQYMFGPDLLVAPVLTSDEFRTVSFPSGVWASLWDGKTVTGPAELKVNTPLDTIPVYLRPGAIVPVELSKDLQFGQSMTPGRVGALVTTPPKENEDVVLFNEQGDAARVIVQATPSGSSWQLKDLPEINYVLIYGTTSAAGVKVDGEELPHVTTPGFDGMPAGWQADSAGNRLVIHLPSTQSKMPTRKIEVDFNPGTK
ncbi:MAG: TIM-barrel domain-containing protein [Verrucomicrobiota bacterium]|jgi:alpha-glucosidase (family GH31 glycosyl hydrolase)